MEITGPRPDDSPHSAPRRGRLAGCLSGCAGMVATVVAGLGTVAGGAWEMLQPQQVEQVRVDDGTCSLAWWRSATGGARYRIACAAVRPLEISRFKLLSGPRGVEWTESVEDWGIPPWEDQRPLSGETVTVNAGRDWRYDGGISMGRIPWVGPAGEVRLSMVVDGRPVTLRAPE